MKIIASALIGITTALLSACGNQPPQAGSFMSPPSGLAPKAAADLLNNPHVQVTPTSFRSCDAADGAIKATLTWDFSTEKIRGIEVYVENGGTPSRLWIAGGRKGSATTGTWVYDGTLFTLVNSELQQPLAQAQIKATACE